MKVWKIKDESEKHTYIFSDYILKPRATVNLRSGSCTNTADTLYWNEHSFIGITVEIQHIYTMLKEN
jgi:hypothetical protein